VEATSENRKKVWKEWTAYCDHVGVTPYLDNCDFRTVARVATMFGGRLRKGRRRKAVSAGTVRAGLGGVNTTIALDTGRQPIHQQDGEHYIKPVHHMLADFKKINPPTEKKLTCHPDLPSFVCTWAHCNGTTTQQKAIGDLKIIEFYYLLHIGEYTTKTRRKKKTQTHQFHAKDDVPVGMITMSKYASDLELMTADTATLCISTQKNGHAGAYVHHSAIPDDSEICPIHALP